MDIQIPHSILTKYLTTNAKPADIASALSLCGPTVDSLEKIGNDWLYHLEIITNRVDSASVYGVAREAAAILPEFKHEAKLKPINLEKTQKLLSNHHLPPLDIEITNLPHLNHRILALKISNVSVNPSPAWLQAALIKFGGRPLNNLIDVTNYVMFELGHPVHVFDYDKITTKKIIVRVAKKGEKIVTLDDKTHIMNGGEIVYDDGNDILIDLPGIMGTKNSVISANTKNILLWIEDNDPQKIREASLLHQIRSHAAILNEKQVDPELSYPALLRSAELMLELSHGKPSSQILDIYPKPVKAKSVTLDLSWLNQFSGIKLQKQTILEILTRLGFKVRESADNQFDCLIPSWRLHDISIKEDLAEEVMRVYGYYRLPSIIPPTTIPETTIDPLLQWEQEVRYYLAHLGFTEIYNHSLVSKAIAKQSNPNLDHIFHLSNPLSNEYEYMRQSLLPSLLQNLTANQNLVQPPIRLFELANIYLEANPLAHERSTLAMVFLDVPFLAAKGYLEALFQFMHLKLSLVPSNRNNGLITDGQHDFGSLEYHSDRILTLELNFEAMAKLASHIHHFTKVPQSVPVIEDLTFSLPEKTHLGYVIDHIYTTDQLIYRVTLKTQFGQNYTFTISYLDQDKQLSAKDVNPIRRKIVTGLAKKFKIKLVGKLS